MSESIRERKPGLALPSRSPTAFRKAPARCTGCSAASPIRPFRHHAGNPLALDVLVVDEASMIDLALMAKLTLRRAAAARAADPARRQRSADW